jgi:hypothetical protein
VTWQSLIDGIFFFLSGTLNYGALYNYWGLSEMHCKLVRQAEQTSEMSHLLLREVLSFAKDHLLLGGRFRNSDRVL